MMVLDNYCRDKSGRISINGAQRVLANVLYAGWIKYENWNIPLQKAKHEGFITKDTYDAVQTKLQAKSKAPQRKDCSLDFPLRGFILCDACGTPMTASWHKGRSKHYAHYFCKQKDCLLFGKVAQRETLENEFEALVVNLKPSAGVMGLVKAILLDVWENRENVEKANRTSFVRQIKVLDADKKQLMVRIRKTNNERLINEYEDEVDDLLNKKEELEKNLPKKTYSQENFGTACDIVFKYLENPVTMWQSENYKDKRLLLEMYFEEKLRYSLKDGLGTATLAYLPKLLCIKPEEDPRLVEMPGVEPGSAKAQIKMFCISQRLIHLWWKE